MVMMVEVAAAAAADKHDGGDAGERQDDDVAADDGDCGVSATRVQSIEALLLGPRTIQVQAIVMPLAGLGRLGL